MNLGKIFKTVGAAFCGLASSTVWASPSPPIYQIIRGQYEDKIRRYSPPEKIFQVFAQFDESKKCSMKMGQLLKAICFYNYSEQDFQKSMKFDPKFIKILLGKDDKFNIYDYFNFVRFITFSQDKIKQFYSDKHLSTLSQDNFVERTVMLEHVCQDYSQFIKEPIYIQSRQFAPNKSEYLQNVKRMAASLFKLRSSYTYEDFINFRLEVMKEIYTFEFRTFKTMNDYIDGVDFARSIVKYAENSYKRRFLRRIFAIEDKISQVKVNESEYVNFHCKMSIKEEELLESLKKKGAMSCEQLQTLFNKHTKNISDDQIKVFFQLLDVDNSQFIEKKEVLGVIQQLGYYWNVKPGENTLTEISKKRWDSFIKKSRKIFDIILDE